VPDAALQAQQRSGVGAEGGALHCGCRVNRIGGWLDPARSPGHLRCPGGEPAVLDVEIGHRRTPSDCLETPRSLTPSIEHVVPGAQGETPPCRSVLPEGAGTSPARMPGTAFAG